MLVQCHPFTQNDYQKVLCPVRHSLAGSHNDSNPADLRTRQDCLEFAADPDLCHHTAALVHQPPQELIDPVAIARPGIFYIKKPQEPVRAAAVLKISVQAAT
jgi:hypothetical protein